MNLSSNKIKYAFIWSIFDKLLNQLGFFLISVYIARIIGPESFGLIGMLTIFILLSESILHGFSQALIQRSNELTEEDSCTVFYTNLIWATVVYLLLYFSAPFIAEFYNQPKLVLLARVLFLSVFINSLMVVFKAKLTIEINFKSQTIAGMYSVIGSSIIGVLLAKLGYGYWALVALILSKNFILLIALSFFSKWKPKLIFSYHSFKGLFKFGSNLMVASMLATILNNLSQLLIGRYYNPTNVGYFTQASNLSNYASQMISSTLQGVTYPIMTSVKRDREQLIQIYKKLISITMLVSLPLLVGFAAISKEVVLLFLGEDWAPVIPVLVALCFARMITPINAINMNMLNAIGRSDLFLKLDLIKTPISLLAIFIAIPYGITALAWANVMTTSLAFFINAHYSGKFFQVGSIKQLKYATNYIVAAALMFLLIFTINTENIYITLLLKIGLGVPIYLLILFLLKDSFFLRTTYAISQRIKSKKNE